MTQQDPAQAPATLGTPEERAARRRALPDPHTYTTAGAWWQDYQGFAPLQIAMATSKLMRDAGITFGEAWDRLVARGAIFLIEYPDDPSAPETER